MDIEDSRNQMTLFNMTDLPEKEKITEQPASQIKTRKKTAAVPKNKKALDTRTKKPSKPAPVKNVSGQVPAGDVRLTANIREDLHLKLKIAAARRRTTIGELIEEFIATYL